ncbi:carboxymuconolactone decarboxylase family protein, partial [[Mycobacterium] nativiensis]
GGLGGRLPLIDLDRADPAQLALAGDIKQISIPVQEATGIQLIGPDGRLIGPFNAYLYNPEIGAALLNLGNVTALSSDLPAAIREIATLSVGGLWGSDYELYAHELSARMVGVPEDAIESLSNGEAPVGLTGDELIAAQFVQQLVQTHHVDDALYQAAEAAFGQKGLVDLVQLVGTYLSTSALLNAFEIQAPLAGDGGVGGLGVDTGLGGTVGESADGTPSGLDGVTGTTGIAGNDGGAGGLGGRLPLIDLDRADPAQLALAGDIKQISIPVQEATGIQLIDPDGRLIGPFNAYLYNPEIGAALLNLGNVTALSSDLPAAIREIATLSVGGLWGSDYELYAHELSARMVGVPEDAIESLSNGEAPVGLTGDELIAAQFVQQLVQTHHVDDALYHAAEAAFGQKGLVDLVQLVGTYLSTSALLNAFEVPAPTSP